MNQGLDPAACDVVILCGGLGTRLQSVLKDRPKPMAEINDRPFLDLLIEYVGRSGFQRFILCTGHKGDQIKKYFEKKDDGKSYVFSREPSPLGTAGAIRYAESLIQSVAFLTLNGDSFCQIDWDAFLQFHASHSGLASVALAPMENSGDYGGVTLGSNGEITGFEEKIPTTSTGWVNAGIYLFNQDILNRIPADAKVSLEHELFPSLTGRGLYGFKTSSQLLDIGTPDRLELARKLLTDSN